MSGAEALPYPPDRSDVVSDAARRCARLAAAADRLAEDLAQDAELLADVWAGAAARGCRAELHIAIGLVRRLVDPLHRSAAHLRDHAVVVAEACSDIDALRREYDELLAGQRRETSRLLRETELVGALLRLQMDDVLAGQQLELASLRRRHGAVLQRVSEHARLTARRISGGADQIVPRPRVGGRPVDAREGELAALLPLLGSARTAAGIGAGPPAPGAAPELARQWWAWLTSDEQQRAVRGWPTTLGSLDGLPGAVRSAANEYRLDRDVATLRTRSALSDDEQRWLDNCLLVRSELHRVRSAHDPLTLDPLTAQLLVFDPRAYDYEGRAALAVGDVDLADHVAFLVPGLGTEVRSSMAALTGTALRLTAEARRAAPGTTTATVAWMGYDAPGFSNVGFDGAAEAGADQLVTDVLAVQASRDVMPHLTIIGHSYGSTTAGTALRDHETGADDLVLVGSPGPNVERASQLHIPAGHVFVGASSRDPISYADRFGVDPTHAAFGAIRFQAEDTGRNSWRLDLDDHSRYFDDDTESLANIVDVVVGDYAAVDRAAYRDEVFLLPDGINSDPEADREPTTVP